jgi:hypothetical protein
MRDIDTSTITDAVKKLCMEVSWSLEPDMLLVVGVQAAQVTQADVQKRIAGGVALALAQGATRVAQEESTREQAVTVRK